MLENFIEYLKIEKRYSVHTLVAYRKDIEQFLEFSSIDNEFDEITQSMIRYWMVNLIDQGVKPVSVNRKLSSVRSFFKFLISSKKVESSPVELVKGPKSEKRLPSFAKESELDVENLNSLFEEDFSGVRDKLIFEFLYQTGMRLSELIALTDSDVHSDYIKVLGKRNKERIIPISGELYGAVQNYKAMRDEVVIEPDSFFVLNSGKKLYPKFVYSKINIYLGKTTGLKKKSPHVLRHTFATHMLNNGAGLEVLKELLGHANLSATQVYTHNSFAELTSIYSQAHPRGGN